MTHSVITPYEQLVDSELFTFSGAHVYYNSDRAFLISQANGTSMLLDRDLLDELWNHSPSEGLRLKLVQRAFATYANSRPVSLAAEKACPVFFMIDLTKRCCLDCRYCFRNFEDNSVISNEVLDDICHFILKHCCENGLSKVNIQAWGGEPLLAFDKIKRIYHNFDGSEVKATICIETNGVPLTPEIVTELRSMQARIGISIDGVPELHNAHRPLLGGQQSMPCVLKGLELLHSGGYYHNHQGICVVTRKSLHCIREIVDYFVDELDLNSFKFGLIKSNPQMKEEGLELSVKEIETFAGRMFDAVIDKMRTGKRFIEHNIRARAVNLLTRKAFDICLSRGCMGGKKMVSIDQQGRIFTCELMDLKGEEFGSVYSEKSLSEQLAIALQKHPYFTKKTSPQCDTCPWHFFCRGGCTSTVRYQKGYYSSSIDTMSCALNRVLYEKVVGLILANDDIIQRLIVDDDNVGS